MHRADEWDQHYKAPAMGIKCYILVMGKAAVGEKSAELLLMLSPTSNYNVTTKYLLIPLSS